MSLLDLIAHSYDELGAARAGAAERVGQIWSNAATQLGQIPEQAQQLQTQQLGNQVTQAQLVAAKAAQQGQVNANSIIATLPQTPDGLFDTDAMTQKFAAANVPPEVSSKLVGSMDSLNQITLKNRQQRTDNLADVANEILTHYPTASDGTSPAIDPSSVQFGVGYAQQQGLITPAQADQVNQAMTAGTDPRTVLETVRGLGKKYNAAPNYEPLPANSPGVVNKNTGGITPTGIPPALKTPGEITAKALGLKAQIASGQPVSDADQAWLDAYNEQTQKQGNATVNDTMTVDGKATPVVIRNGAPFDLGGQPIDPKRIGARPPASASAVTVSMTDPAIDQAAQKYLDTGQLPSGMGGAAVTRNNQIMNRAAQINGGASLSANSAEYAANKSTLTAATKQLNNLQAFENTANANLKQFTDLANAIPDTGVPWLNTPVRALSQNLVGSTAMPAVNAARQVALTEISRIVSNPNLTGQLSDSARSEVMGLSPDSATLPQIKAVVNVLQQDMANRRTALQAQVSGIQSRLGGGAPPPPSSAQFTHQPVPGHAGVFASSTDGGKTWKVDGGG